MEPVNTRSERITSQMFGFSDKQEFALYPCHPPVLRRRDRRNSQRRSRRGQLCLLSSPAVHWRACSRSECHEHRRSVARIGGEHGCLSETVGRAAAPADSLTGDQPGRWLGWRVAAAANAATHFFASGAVAALERHIAVCIWKSNSRDRGPHFPSRRSP